MNNEDMSEIINKFSSIINSSKSEEANSSTSSDNSANSDNPSISPEAISNIIKMLGQNNSNNNENTDNSENNSMPNIDIETILKFKTIFDKMNSKDDPRARLLRALKPYLKESRKEKVEQYIQFFNISKVIDLFGNASGGDVHK